MDNEWKTLHQIMSCALFAYGPAIRCAGDFLQCLSCSPLELQAQTRLPLLIKRYETGQLAFGLFLGDEELHS